MSGLGVAYSPPTENTPTFNSAYFNRVVENITSSSGLQYFLAYPNAQGTENFQAINVGDDATFANNIIMSGTGNYLEFPDGTQQTTAANSSSILSTNNTWTGTNLFKDTTSIGNSINSNKVNLNSSSTLGSTLVISGQEQNLGLLVGNTTNTNSIQLSCSTTSNNYLTTTGSINAQNFSVPNDGSGTLNYINFRSSLPSGAIGTGVNSGLSLGWNWTGGGGEVDFLCLGQGANIGGMNFYICNAYYAPALLMSLTSTSTNSTGGGTRTNAINFNVNPTISSGQYISTYPSTSNSSVASIEYVNNAIASISNSSPIITGMVLQYGGFAQPPDYDPPAGYLWCNGAIYNIDDYQDLANVIGSYYGGNGSTTFAVPNFHNGETGTYPVGGQNCGLPITGNQWSEYTGCFVYNGSLNTTFPYTGGQFGGSVDICLNQVPDHYHNLNLGGHYLNSASGNGITTVGGSTNVLESANSSVFSTNSLNMVDPSTNSYVYYPNGSTYYGQTQAQFYPSFCCVQYIIKT